MAPVTTPATTALATTPRATPPGPNFGISLWDVRAKRLLKILPFDQKPQAFAFAPDGKSLACAGARGTITLWDLSTASCIRTLKHLKGTIFSVSFSPDGRTLASGGDDGTVKLWRIK